MSTQDGYYCTSKLKLLYNYKPFKGKIKIKYHGKMLVNKIKLY